MLKVAIQFLHGNILRSMVMKILKIKAKPNSKAKTIYFGAGWFDQKQIKAYNAALSALNKNKTIDLKNSYIPVENQYGNEIHSDAATTDLAWEQGTFGDDMLGVKQTDICIGVYLPSEEDVGLGIELGYAYQLGKPIVFIIPDDEFGDQINVMSWGVADDIIKTSEVSSYNFNAIRKHFYRGKVY